MLISRRGFLGLLAGAVAEASTIYILPPAKGWTVNNSLIYQRVPLDNSPYTTLRQIVDRTYGVSMSDEAAMLAEIHQHKLLEIAFAFNTSPRKMYDMDYILGRSRRPQWTGEAS